MGTIVDSVSELKIKLERRYNSARLSVLLVVIFTVLNVVSMFFGGSIYFFFSAVIPLYTMMMGMVMGELFIGDGSGQALGSFVFFSMLAIAAVMLLPYLMCWLFSKKHMYGWLIAALVMFSVDTLVMLIFDIPTVISNDGFSVADSFALSLDMILNTAFHIWVIVDLSGGIAAHFKLKKLPIEEIPVAEDGVVSEVVTDEAIAIQSEATAPVAEIAENPAKNSVEASDEANFI